MHRGHPVRVTAVFKPPCPFSVVYGLVWLCSPQARLAFSSCESLLSKFLHPGGLERGQNSCGSFSVLAPREEEVAVRDDKKREKTWRAIAAEVSKEPDSDKVAKLSQELIQALDEDTREISACVEIRGKKHAGNPPNYAIALRLTDERYGPDAAIPQMTFRRGQIGGEYVLLEELFHVRCVPGGSQRGIGS